MAKKRAEIEASLVGGQQVRSEATAIAGTFQKTAATIQSGLGAGLKSVGGALAGVISGGLQAAGVFQSINLAGAVEQAKQLDAVTARLGQSAGIAGTTLKASFEAAESKTLTSAVNLAEVSKSLGRVTYDGKFAAESLQALGDDALAMGREIGDELPLAAFLHPWRIPLAAMVPPGLEDVFRRYRQASLHDRAEPWWHRFPLRAPPAQHVP